MMVLLYIFFVIHAFAQTTVDPTADTGIAGETSTDTTSTGSTTTDVTESTTTDTTTTESTTTNNTTTGATADASSNLDCEEYLTSVACIGQYHEGKACYWMPDPEGSEHECLEAD